MQFREKNVLITGAADGMGRIFTRRFLELGASVAAWDIDELGLANLERTMGAPVASNGDARLRVYACDVSSPSAIAAAAERTLAEMGRIDIIVNNAGIVSGDWILDLSLETVEKTFAVNVLAPIRITKTFLPGMIRRGEGHIATMASAGGYIGTPRLSEYCASKSALVSFDESLRMEMKQLGHPIRTTVITPFFVDTEMFRGVKTRFRWLLPILSRERVVQMSLKAIYRKKARLVLPRFVYVTFICRILPVAWFDWLSSFFGITSTMDAFVGHGARGNHPGNAEDFGQHASGETVTDAPSQPEWSLERRS